jgi:hypothetical protein
VEKASNLSTAAAWVPVPGYVDIVGGNQTVVITQAASGATAFYRLKVWLQ